MFISVYRYVKYLMCHFLLSHISLIAAINAHSVTRLFSSSLKDFFLLNAACCGFFSLLLGNCKKSIFTSKRTFSYFKFRLHGSYDETGKKESKHSFKVYVLYTAAVQTAKSVPTTVFVLKNHTAFLTDTRVFFCNIYFCAENNKAYPKKLGCAKTFEWYWFEGVNMLFCYFQIIGKRHKL